MDSAKVVNFCNSAIPGPAGLLRPGGVARVAVAEGIGPESVAGISRRRRC